MKDGSVKEFRHQGRPGGSYTKKLSQEGSFICVTDEYYNKTYIPSGDVKEIKIEPY